MNTLRIPPRPDRRWVSSLTLLASVGLLASTSRTPAQVPPPNGPGYALSLDGVNDHLTAAPPALPAGNSPYTIEAWIRPNSMHVGAVAAWGNYGVNNQVNAFVLDGSGLINYWWANDLSAPTPNLAGTWHHVAATFDGTTRRILLDGVVMASDTPLGHNAGTANFRIGLANTGQFFNGQMDEVRVWNTGRTAAQIQQSMRRQVAGTEPGLVACWRLDEGAGLAAADATGTAANAATLVNGPAWVVSTTLPFAPTVSTLAPVNGPAGTATLSGAAMFNGAATTAYFEWGATTSYGNQTAAQAIGSGNGSNTFSQLIPGLSPGVLYHGRAVATNIHGASYGADRTFGYGFTNVVLNANDSGPGSLRQAILDAAPENVLVFAPAVSGTITLASELVITQSLKILGPGAGVLALSGAQARRVLSVTGGTNLIAGLTFRDGLVLGATGRPGGSVAGGGIVNQATLTLSNCLIAANVAQGGNGVDGGTGGILPTGGNAGTAQGGGIHNLGNLTVLNCAFRENRASGGNGGLGRLGNFGSSGGHGGAGFGGAIANDGVLTLLNTTFATNRVTGGNGGAVSEAGDPLGNGGHGEGGAVASRTGVQLVHVTLTGNAAAGGAPGRFSILSGTPGNGHGGGLRVTTGTGRLLNCVVAQNTATNGTTPSDIKDVSGGVTSDGHNLVGVTNGSSGWVTSDLRGTAGAPLNAQLNPLADNGGPTPSVAPQPGSPAVDGGDDATLSAPYDLLSDQRGVARPAGSHVDIGAMELTVARLVSIAYPRPWLVATLAGSNTFLAEAAIELNAPMQAGGTQVTVQVTYEFRDETNGLIALASNQVTRVVNAGGAGTMTLAVPVAVAPVAQLDSVNHAYGVVASLTHRLGDGPVVAANTIRGPTNQFLAFNGRLLFGARALSIAGFGQAPTAGAVVPGSHVPVTLREVQVVSPLVPGFQFARAILGGVQLLANGDATNATASFTLALPSIPPAVLSNVCFTRTSFTLSPAGISANDLVVKLPTGFGYTQVQGSARPSRVLQSRLPFGTVAMDDALRPAAATLASAAGNYLFCEETKPMWMPASSLTWFVQDGRFEFVANGPARHIRATEYNDLATALPLANEEARVKKSNDRYYEAISGINPTTIRAGTKGEALLSTQVGFAPYQFTAHFPYGARLGSSFISGNPMVISNDLPVGGLMTMQASVLTYGRDCPNAADCPGAVNGQQTVTFLPDANFAHFTVDGGFVTEATVSGPGLQWGSIGPGTYAQTNAPFTRSGFHMPGHFLRGDLATGDAAERPGVILNTGAGRPGNPAYLERPGTLDYRTNGQANYAGLNFRSGIGGGADGGSILAGRPVGPYNLRANSKYYARYGGVSGVHEPVPGAIPALQLYGYDFTFSSFGVSYLGNRVEESRINGSVKVPYPSDFTQSFAGLTLTCNGALEAAELPAGGPPQLLKYWNARFVPLAMEFEGANNCNPAARFLVLGVETYAAHVPQPLHGALGFKTNANNGNLVTAADTQPPYGGAGIDSRLEMPATLTLRGPSGQTYPFTSVGRAYLNNFDHLPVAPGTLGAGFINFAGRLDVPFFADLPVHIQTVANTNNADAPFHVMGGWPARQGDLPHHGWREPATEAVGHHFFNTPPTGSGMFDQANRGFPAETTFAIYRTNDFNPLYHPRAQQLWVDMLDFDLPLKWDSGLRVFTQFQPATMNLLLVKAEGQVRRMDARSADLTFGAELSALPKINIGNLAFSILDPIFPGIANGLNSALQDALGANDLLGGIQALDNLLSARPDVWMGEMLNRGTNPILDRAANDLYANLTLGNGGFLPAGGGTTAEIVRDYVEGELNRLISEQVASSGAGQLIYDITNTLGKVDKTLATILEIVEKDPATGQRHVAYRLVRALVDEEAAAWAGWLAEGPVRAAIEEIGPTFDDIINRVADVRGYIAQVHAKLRSAQEFQLELANIVATRVGDVSERIIDKVNDNLQRLNPTAGPPGNGFLPAGGGAGSGIPEAQFKAMVKRVITEEMAFSTLGADLQVALKQRLQDPAILIRSIVDTMFQQINLVIRDSLISAVSQIASNSTFQKFSGALENGGASASLQGYAHLNGDTLEKLRLDGRFQLDVPDTMRFDAYLEFAQRESESYPEGCRPQGDKATEIAFGADNAQIEWLFKDLRATIGNKITISGGGVSGFAGHFALESGPNGGIELGVIKVKELAAVMAFGVSGNELREAYFGARARARLNAYEVAGGIWFGKACTKKPLEIIDPTVAEVLPAMGPYIGGYAYAEGWVPVNEWIGIPSTCALNIRAGVGMGMFYFETGNPSVSAFGAKALLGADVELLCIAHAQAVIRLIGGKVAGDLKLKGRGDVNVEIGSCPFCLEFDATVKMGFENGSWYLDL